MADGVGWIGLFFGVDGDGDAALFEEKEEEEGDVADEVDDECEETVFRTRNRIVACCARTLRSERSR